MVKVNKMRKNAAAIRESLPDRIFLFILYVALSIIGLVFLYPMYYVVIASISSPFAIYRGEVILWPVSVTFEGYKEIFADTTIWRGYANSIFYTVFGTLTSLAATLPAGYALSRKDLSGRNVIMFFITFTMFFSGGLVPTYLMVRQLGIVNTIWAVLLVNAVSAWNLILARTFFMNTIPVELWEASVLDGCNNTRFFLKVALPLSSAIVALLALYYGVGQWNSYFKELIYLDNPNMYPLQMVLRSILVKNQIPPTMLSDFETLALKQQMTDLLKYGLMLVASLPVFIAYPFVQRYFIKGVMVGSLKG